MARRALAALAGNARRRHGCGMFADWHRLLPDEEYRFHMGLRPGDGGKFFAATAESSDILRQRAGLLEEAPGPCLLLPENEGAESSLREALALMSGWRGVPLASAVEAGKMLEPDWLILSPDADGALRVSAGAVCFPSGWSLPEKAGLRVSEVHGVVPALNDALAGRIDMFLSRLIAGAAWERENWGLSAHAARDHHPRHRLPALNESATLESTWLRLEQQLFARLPCGGVLFAIRVSSHRLDELCGLPAIASRLARAVSTMPADIAEYKGIAAARARLVDFLTAKFPLQSIPAALISTT